MRIKDPKAFAANFERLRAVSYVNLMLYFCEATQFRMRPRPATLQRIGNPDTTDPDDGKVRHSLDSPEEIAAFVCVMMAHALDQGSLQRDDILECGRQMLAASVGERWVDAVFKEVEQKAREIRTKVDLISYFEGCAMLWLGD